MNQARTAPETPGSFNPGIYPLEATLAVMRTNDLPLADCADFCNAVADSISPLKQDTFTHSVTQSETLSEEAGAGVSIDSCSAPAVLNLPAGYKPPFKNSYERLHQNDDLNALLLAAMQNNPEIQGNSFLSPRKGMGRDCPKSCDQSHVAILQLKKVLCGWQPRYTPIKQGNSANWRTIMKSWKTTALGVLALIYAASAAGIALLDSNPETLPQMDAVFAAFVGLMGVFARDNDVTSEESGAVEASAKRKVKQDIANSRPYKPMFLMMFCLLPAIVLTGCSVPNYATIHDGKDTQVQAATGLQSIATMGKDGKMTAAFNGAAPTQLNQDNQGTYMQTQGSGGWITFNPETSAVMLYSPKDTIIEGLEITPNPTEGQTSFKATKITANISDVAKVYADQFVSVADEIRDMDKNQAQARVDALVAAGTITRDVADAVMAAMFPLAKATDVVSDTDTANDVINDVIETVTPAPGSSPENSTPSDTQPDDVNVSVSPE